MRLSERQVRQFAVDGFVVAQSVVDEALLKAADTEIDSLIEADPPAPDTTGKHFWFLPPEQLPAADAALRESPALALAEQLTAPLSLGHALDHIQVALNIPPYDHRPGGPHIDGHVRQHADQTAPDSFTLLAAVFLSDERAVDRGNVWVWPGSHLVHERLFDERGSNALMSTQGHVSMLEQPPDIGTPVPVLANRGDLLLAHFMLGHNTGGNLSAATRRVLYYRLACPGHREHWAETFLDVFTEFPRLRGA